MTNATNVYNDEPESTADKIVVAVIGLIGMFLNTATLIVMLKNFSRIFSNVEACFVTNLCVADLGSNIGAIFWASIPLVHYPSAFVWTLHCALWATVSASFLTLSCMAVERLLVVVSPVKAQRMLKKPFAYVCCAVLWGISIVAGGMIAVDPLIAQCAMVVMFEVSLIATIGCYIRIYFTVRKLNRDGFRTAARYNANNANLKLEVEENEPALHHRVAVRQESRVTTLVFLLSFILAITVLPYMVLLQVYLAHVLHCPGCQRLPGIGTAIDVLFPMEMLNFIINPAVYAWRLPKFRQASKRTLNQLLCCKKWRGNSDAVPGRNYSYSSSSDSLANGPVTFFTGQDTGGAQALNNNRH